MIHIQGLKKFFKERLLFDIPEYTFEDNRIHILAGENGVGKTTLMRIINGLEPADEGTVNTGTDRHGMVLCFQKPYMFAASVVKNVEYGLKIRGIKHPREHAAHMLIRLGLDNLAERDARTLSGGEMQRVALARAMIIEPKLLLLDEPFANLDARGRKKVEEVLLDHKANGGTVLITTHLTEHLYHLTADVTRLAGGMLLPHETLNIFEGSIYRDSDLTYMRINENISIAVATASEGQVRAVLAPADVVLSNTPVESSMRNLHRGVITAIDPKETYVELTVDISGLLIIAHITAFAQKQLGLVLNSPVYTAFKATAVKVY